jgi:hypothetical protein
VSGFFPTRRDPSQISANGGRRTAQRHVARTIDITEAKKELVLSPTSSLNLDSSGRQPPDRGQQFVLVERLLQDGVGTERLSRIQMQKVRRVIAA